MKLHRISDEVFTAPGPIARLGDSDIEFIMRQASMNQRGRARICAHSDDATVHEMLIAISASSYVQPHKHIGKSESFHVVYGIVDVVLFDDNCAVTDIVELGCHNSGRSFFYRLSDSRFHMPMNVSDMVVIHEVTNGPFDRDLTVFAPMTPEQVTAAVARFR